MTGIYKITNQLNGKAYIGQSIHIEQRWEEHLYKSSSCHLLKYALHKYGVENFTFEILEECNQEQLNEREIYWIAHYDTFKNGYNLTMGGGGTIKYSIEAIYEEYLKTQSLSLTAKNIGCHTNTARRVLNEYGITHFGEWQEGRKIQCVDPQTLNVIHTFNSITEAAAKMNVNTNAIQMAISGKHLSCCGYYWKYLDEEKTFIISTPKKWKTAVQQIDRNTNKVIATFESASAAAAALGKDRKNGGSQITAVCSGRKPSAYGYFWKRI